MEKEHSVPRVAAMALVSLALTYGWTVIAPQVTQGAGSSPFCSTVNRLYPDLPWRELHPGTQLGASDAILTCGSGRVVLRSMSPSSHNLEWVRSAGAFESTVAEESLVVLEPSVDGATLPTLTIETVTVWGEAYFTTDREAIRRYRLSGATGMSLADHANLEANRDRDLAALKWDSLVAGRIFGPWSMIWTLDGRVEIEVLDPPGRIIRGWAGAIDETGQPSGKNRLMENVHFIMVPPFFRQARVNRVIGDVRIASDPETVKRYFYRHRYVVARFGPLDEERWDEILRKPELE